MSNTTILLPEANEQYAKIKDSRPRAIFIGIFFILKKNHKENIKPKQLKIAISLMSPKIMPNLSKLNVNNSL
jgi:hypothetical protein